MAKQEAHKKELHYTHDSIAEGAGIIRVSHVLGRNTVLNMYPYHLQTLRKYIDNIYTYAMSNREMLHYYSPQDKKEFTELYMKLHNNNKLNIIE